MSAPHFDTWSQENLAKFAKQSYEKLQRQDEELQNLRINFRSLREEAIRLHEQLEKNNVG